jgi:hypothetical protein
VEAVMAVERQQKRRGVPTVWRVPDEMWNRIAVLTLPPQTGPA